MDEKKTPQAPAVAAVPDPAAQPPPTQPTAPPPELVLRKGSRIQLGFRKGVVDQIRGAGKKPYDVRVKWDGEKYPVFMGYRALEMEFAKGHLKVA